MVNPATLLIVGAITGIGGAVTYATFHYAERIGSNQGGMAMRPRDEGERLAFHERIFGKGSTPPLERLGRGQTVNNLLPMPPTEGPPLPRIFAIRWPKFK